MALISSSPDAISLAEHGYATDSRVRQILVEEGLGPSYVHMEQKSPALVARSPEGERIPASV